MDQYLVQKDQQGVHFILLSAHPECRSFGAKIKNKKKNQMKHLFEPAISIATKLHCDLNSSHCCRRF